MNTHDSKPSCSPELLAPVGTWESLDAALRAGADAVYLGLDEGFHARAKTQGFSLQNLEDAVFRAHRSNAKVYITLNTLVFESELEALVDLIRGITRAGVDALIVQDPAVCRIAQKVAPRLELHASTQMTICSPEAARFAELLGINRVVVPRELSLKQIRSFAQNSSMELEVFVHGALCMSWSGQCLSGEAWLGRSANRGQCNQGCRLPYDLVVNGETVDSQAQRFLLSPQDLMAVDHLDELTEIGVSSLKIEGRYKGPGYVEQNVALYRAQIDQSLDPQAREKGLQASALEFSRGFGAGHLLGSQHQDLVDGGTSDHRGILLGRVHRRQASRIWIEMDQMAQTDQGAWEPNSDLDQRWPVTKPPQANTSRPPNKRRLPVLSNPIRPRPPTLRPGMGIVIGEGTSKAGGRIFSVHPEEGQSPRGSSAALNRSTTLVVVLGKRATGLAQVQPGQKVWLNSAAPGGRTSLPPRSSAFSLELIARGKADNVLEVELCEPRSDLRVCAQSEQRLQRARHRGLGQEMLREKLGGAEMHLRRIDTQELEDALFIPPSQLKALKRELWTQFIDARKTRQKQRVVDARAASTVLQELKSGGAGSRSISKEIAFTKTTSPELTTGDALSSNHRPHPLPNHAPNERRWSALCRNDAQLDACIAAGMKEVDLDWMEFIGLRAAVDKAKQAGLIVNIATVRVQKPGEEGYDRRIEALQPHGVLLRHLGAVMHFARIPAEDRPILHGDFSLNLCNSLSAQILIDLGLSTLTASHDLDLDQLLALQQSAPGLPLTVTLHHHLPLFHNDHCVYAKHLSNGQDFRTCQRPCDHNRIHLRDHQGHEHPVIVDVECRNTVFNARAQSAARAFKTLVEAGISFYRIEFAWEDFGQAVEVLRLYQGLDQGKHSADALLKELAVNERFGVSMGTLAQRRGPQSH